MNATSPLPQRKLMILGAGPFQLSGIRKAVDLGHYVITVDNSPANVGHQVSHQMINCSTTDRVGVARQAEDLSIDGICTFASDVALTSIGYVCDRLHLPGISLGVAEMISKKDRFRSFQRDHSLPHPKFVVGSSLQEANFTNLAFPVIFKPVDSSGSRGVGMVAEPFPDAIDEAFAHAKSYSRSERVCVEEFIAGTEVGGDCVLHRGKIVFAAITHKHLSEFVVTGHNLPPNITVEDQWRVRTMLERSCAELGYSDGPLNFDVMVGPTGVVVLEMSARTGGNGIPEVIKRATGVDVEEVTIRYALGDTLPPGASAEGETPFRGTGSLVFGSPTAGILTRIATLAEVKSLVPELFELHFAAQPGSVVRPFEHNGNLIGYALFDCNSASAYAETAARVLRALDIKVDSDKSGRWREKRC
jgi:biotin carboxylase